MAHLHLKARDVLAYFLMIPSPIPEPNQGKHNKKDQKANTLQERESLVVLTTPQTTRKKVDTTGLLPSIVYQTSHTDIATAEFYPNGFTNNKSSLNNSNQNYHMDINS